MRNVLTIAMSFGLIGWLHIPLDLTTVLIPSIGLLGALIAPDHVRLIFRCSDTDEGTVSDHYAPYGLLEDEDSLFLKTRFAP